MPIGDPDAFSAPGAPTYAQPALPDAVSLLDLVRCVISLEVERQITAGQIATIQQTLASKMDVTANPPTSETTEPEGRPDVIVVTIPCVLTREDVELRSRVEVQHRLTHLVRNLHEVVLERLLAEVKTRGWAPKDGW